MDDKVAILAAQAAGGDEGARAELALWLASHRDNRGDHAAWAQTCEAAGEHGLAFTEYQLALRDDPESPDTLARLAVLYEERGEFQQAAHCAADRWRVRPDAAGLEALFALLISAGALEQAAAVLEEAPARLPDARDIDSLRARLASERRNEAAPVDEGPLPGPLPFTDADVVRFTHLFAGRENVHARQWAGGEGEVGYSPVRDPFTVREARSHLLGAITAGIYLVRLDDTVTLFAVDIDITKRAIAGARGSLEESRRVRGLAAEAAIGLGRSLADLGLPPLLEDSGYKGRHVWVFLEEPESAAVVRNLGNLLLSRFPLRSRELHAEFFPKQATAGGGVGNLIKLPLGIHRRTGRRSRILGPDGSPETDPFGALRRHPRVSRAMLHAAIGRLKATAVVVAAGLPGAGEPDDERPVDVPEVPAPPEAPPAWTAADFDTNAEIAHLFRRCAVLGALKEKAERNRRLTHEERLVLAHAVGHSGSGVLAVNYLFDLAVDTPRTALLQSPHSGNPISCPKIRKRIPHITGTVACHCEFEAGSDHYPTPRLHLHTLPAGPGADEVPARVPPAWDPVDRAKALGVLWARRARMAAEIADLEAQLLGWLERSGSAGVDTGDGTMAVVQEAGAPPALVWRPKTSDAEPSAGAASAPAPEQAAGRGATEAPERS